MKSKKKTKKPKVKSKVAPKPQKNKKKKNYYRKTVEQFRAETIGNTSNSAKETIEDGTGKLEAEVSANVFIGSDLENFRKAQKELAELQKNTVDIYCCHTGQNPANKNKSKTNHETEVRWYDTFFAIFGFKRKK